MVEKQKKHDRKENEKKNRMIRMVERRMVETKE